MVLMAWADTSEQHGHVDALGYRLVRLTSAGIMLGKPEGRSSARAAGRATSAE